MKTEQAVQAKPVETTNSTTIIEFLLDETGSMSSCRDATIGGFNEYLVNQKQQPGKCLLTLTKFDTNGLRTPYVDLAIQMAPDLNYDTYTPSAMTNLYDAIGNRVLALEKRIAEQNWAEKPHVLFVIMTDGEDNSSREFTAASIKEFNAKREKDGWTFVYLGANQDAWTVGRTMGMAQGNTMSYDTAKTKGTMRRLSEATTSYRALRASGAVGAEVADTNFFTNESDEADDDFGQNVVEEAKKTKIRHRKGIKERFIKGVTADSRAFSKEGK